ncbi:hypothetical protein I350_02610 [Cryptococcus amylolentus CBS 6273]|uniref:CCD97-like C-terminal domain-containing protein n=1 Tax=Cryptococcus amylolentus CBS 6273 TaxID=1296118 RepID=A0A1E3K752_9TREE|nr:hypothetical protein I350_02610 [Cryptococcus amylolentus CBS 6273]
MSVSPEHVSQILSYLQLPASETLPSPPLEFLTKYIQNLPSSLLEPFSFISPKERTSIPTIKRRRLIYSTTSPSSLSSAQGRLRWPLLWERLGGDPFAETSQNAEDEAAWANSSFMQGTVGNQQVKKLGGFLRLMEEDREAEDVRAAKRMERRLDQVGEEFEEESDDEEDEANGGEPRVEVAEDQEEVERVFERRLLELFLDGLDTLDYSPIDFEDPPGGDPIAIRDAEDRYFEDESPSRTPNGTTQGNSLRSVPANADEKSVQNGQGDYDY